MKRVLASTLALLFGALFFLIAPATANAATCTAQIGDGCGAYDWSGWPGSNGYNTYVADQAVDVQPGSTGSITVTDPSNWTATANYGDCGGCVQTATAVNQLTNNWGTRGWNGIKDTPLPALSKFQVKYAETSPPSTSRSDPNQYEFATDIWTNYSGNACGGCGDVMAWTDTSPERCFAVNGWNIFGQATISGQGWTAYTPGGKGEEVILVLNGPGGPGTCARQTSGTIHELGLIKWLSGHPGPTGFPRFANVTMSLFVAGWEITAGNGGNYAVTSLSFPVTVR